jgi:glycosidase
MQVFSADLLRQWRHPLILTASVCASALLVACLTVAGCASGGNVVGVEPTLQMAAVNTGNVPKVDPGTTLTAGWQHGAFMEIFVRGFKDSDGDGIGDLRGLTQSLGYLKELGVKGIWLMPITRSADRDHGYATTDFRSIEPDYGNLADFDALIAQAHAHGIGVIMDYVVNHSSAQHPLFVASSSGVDNRYRDWYVWRDRAPLNWNIWGKTPWNETPHGSYFATFGARMPDFNLRNEDVVAYHEDSLRFWLNRGLDGFRFDAMTHLIENGPQEWNDQPESHQLTYRLRGIVNSYANRHVVCEATANPQVYAGPLVCGSAFAFGHERNIVNAAKGQPDAIRAVASYFITAPMSLATMVSNHDIFAGERLWDQMVGDTAQYQLAAATYLLQPGTPFIYYGEEIGMAGVGELPGDAPLRTPMSWTGEKRTGGFTSAQPFRPLSPNVFTHNVALQRADPHSIWAFYRDMLKLRNTLPSLALGSYEQAFVDGKVMGYQRKVQGETALVVVNYDSSKANLRVGKLVVSDAWVQAYPLGDLRLAVDSGGIADLEMQPQSVRVFYLRP